MPKDPPAWTDALVVESSGAEAAPPVPVLWAACVALMSAYAAPPPTHVQDGARHRHLLALKVCANLRRLHGHPDLPAPLHGVARQALQHWQALCPVAPPEGGEGAALPPEEGTAGARRWTLH